MTRKIRLKNTLCSIGLVLIVLSVLQFSLFNSVLQGADASQSVATSWFYSGWQYRKEHNITNGETVAIRFYDLSDPWITISGNPTDRHAFQPVHNTAIVECNKVVDGAVRKYLAYDSNDAGSQIRLYYSDDIGGMWIPYSGNPILSGANNFRWPSTAYVDGVFHMFLTDRSNLSLERWTSTDGINFTFQENVRVGGSQWKNPFIWLNPNDNRWYLYSRDASGVVEYFTVRNASKIEDLDIASDTIIVSKNIPFGAPSMTFYDDKYWLLGEIFESGVWKTVAYYSTTSPSSEFKECINSPILSNDEACAKLFLNSNQTKAYLFISRDKSAWYQETREVYLNSTITTEAPDLADYQIKIKTFYGNGVDNGENIYLNGHSRADFGDIRFTWFNSSSQSEVSCPYWIEELTLANSAVFWVKVPEIQSNTNTTIYIYYGKSDVATTSNGNATFDFFDDFSGDLSKWTVVGGTWQIENGELSAQTTASPFGQRIRANNFSFANHAVHVKVKWISGTYFEHGPFVRGQQPNEQNNGYMTFLSTWAWDSRYRISKMSSGMETTLAGQGNTNPPQNVWYSFVFQLYGSKLKSSITPLYSTELRGVDNAFANGTLCLFSWSAASEHAHYDNLFVRKYVDPEPSHGAWGSEETYVANASPTIGEFQSPSIVYANKYFYLNATINDPNGVADFANATVELSNSVVLQWINSTNIFSVQSDPNGYCTLDASESLRTSVNSTAYKFSWRIKLNWTYPEGYKSILSANTKVFDNQGSSGSSSHTNLFTFEDNLIVYSASVDDSRTNPSQTINFSGTLYYQGTTTPPEDTNGITVKVNLEATTKGSTTTIGSDGTFSISFASETNIGSYSYTVYAITDEPSVQNQTVNVKVDRIIITFETNKTNPANGETVTFTVSPTYESDNEPVASFTYDINRNATLFKNDSPSSTFTDSASDTTYVYDLLDFVDLSNGILTWVDPPDMIVKWSENLSSRYVVIDQAFASDGRANVGSIQVVGFHAKWDNGSDVVQGNIYVNGIEYTTNSSGWINFTVTSSLVGKQEWTITSVNCGGVTSYTQTAPTPSIIWDRIKITDGGLTKNSLVLGESTTIWFRTVYEYDNSTFADANGILYVNGSSMLWSTANNRWQYDYIADTPGITAFSVSNVSDDLYNLTAINDAVGAQALAVLYSPFSIISNSTVTELAFNSTSKEISFTVSGPPGTTGFTNVTIAKTLIANISTLKVYLDGSEITYTSLDLDYYWLIHFTYNHSTHKVVIRLSSLSTANTDSSPAVSPETVITISSIVIATIAMIMLVRKKRHR